MKQIAMSVLIWWFATYATHYSGWLVLGPFESKVECEKIHSLIEGVKKTPCWKGR